MVVDVDPADPQTIAVDFWAGWGEDARREAAIEEAILYVGAVDPVPEGVVVRMGDRRSVGTFEQPLPCDPDSCAFSTEIWFEAEPRIEPFLVEVSRCAALPR